ncbi:MAG: hypothetical protein SF066_23010 [Thermoanaerobaculia bacterium]|nr:hypothetical protein [Thermoanaerobaculia bacterium]
MAPSDPRMLFPEAGSEPSPPSFDDPDTPIEGAGGPTDGSSRPDTTPPPSPPPPG